MNLAIHRRGLFAAVVSYIINLLAAVFGTVVVESSLWFLFHSMKPREMIIAEDATSVTIAFLTGCVTYLRWRPVAAKWIWVAGLCWFSARAALVVISERSFRSEFSGIGCLNGLTTSECVSWFEFTLPFLRTLFYSIGSICCSLWFNPAADEGG